MSGFEWVIAAGVVSTVGSILIAAVAILTRPKNRSTRVQIATPTGAQLSLAFGDDVTAEQVAGSVAQALVDARGSEQSGSARRGSAP